MTPAEALAFVEQHGIVCEAACRGPVPSLVDAVAGEPVRGNWWTHPQARTIFALTRAVREADDVLVCRLVDGKITFVHARLWPALVRIAERFARGRLARMHERHEPGGKHVVEETSFPEWVPTSVAQAARRMSETEALGQLPQLPSRKA
jgi:hypothetical protein